MGYQNISPSPVIRTQPVSQLKSSAFFGYSNRTPLAIMTLPTNPPSTSYCALPTPPPTPPTVSKPRTFTNFPPTLNSDSKMLSSNLHTLPVELLLTIIAYLPTNSYQSLTRTSHTLRAFFANYASKICNQRILTHFSAEASILKASFTAVDSMVHTWLVPTHEAILRAEENLWDREGSISSLNPRYTDEEALAFQKRMLLSQPGPQFLLFLERRGWEVQTRHSMMEDKLRLVQETSDSGSWDSGLERTKMQLNSFLSWSLERGVVRGFLEELGSFSEAFLHVEQPDAEDTCEKQTQTFQNRLRSKGMALKAKFGKLGRRKSPKQPEGSSLLFGEIPSDSEKTGISTKELEFSGLSEGLLWYHGRTGVSGHAPPAFEATRTQGPLHGNTKDKMRLRRCVRSMVKSVAKTGRKVKNTLSLGWSCGNGRFESLD
ncbi:hypothetical protein GLAREA_01191 [Glarea lozoyensis ATCC 20868]|uniref:F-box domain-containing protein n=1 Tax=Glarea lozoyensis (strain ATCC 20868 / MF5171) TaxID=1116229 RepID=S3CJ96_GLAL2|nr:uncharacterized protein GLAREA_01191 [Glarea lozoyensis ATCC 20868]EPE25279.1 hypothetical protein GLAREA_01191 [Glarea lozoyensis ATCC 20868]